MTEFGVVIIYGEGLFRSSATPSIPMGMTTADTLLMWRGNTYGEGRVLESVTPLYIAQMHHQQ